MCPEKKMFGVHGKVRGICVSGWSNSICKDLKVGTDFSMFEECGFFSSSYSSETFILLTAPVCLFFTIIQNIHLSKHEKFPLPCHAVAAFDTFEYSLLLEMPFFTFTFTRMLLPTPLHSPQPSVSGILHGCFSFADFGLLDVGVLQGLAFQPSALLDLGN